MSRSRFTLAAFCLVLPGLVAAVFLLYQNLPGILKTQLNNRLQHYGVRDIDYEPVHFSNHALRVDGLRWRGTYGGLAYEARADAVDLRYDWRTLVAGKIRSLAVSGLHLSVVQTRSSEQSVPVDIDLDAFLPQRIMEQLPLQTLRVEDWQLSYRSEGLPPLSARGNLRFDEHLELQLASTLAGGELTAELRLPADPPVLELALALREGDADAVLASAQLTRAGGDAWEWNLQGEWHYAPLLQWLRRLGAGSGLALPIPPVGNMSIEGDSAMTAVVRHPSRLQWGPASAKSIHLPEQLTASIHTVNAIRDLDYQGAMEALRGTVPIDVQLERRRLSATLQPSRLDGDLVTARLALAVDTLHWLGWLKAVPVRWENAAPLRVDYDEHGRVSLTVRDTALTLGGSETALAVRGLQLDAALADGEPMPLGTQLDATVEARLRNKALPPLTLGWRQQGNVEHSEIALQLADNADSFLAALQGTINLATGAGESRLNATLTDLPRFTATAMPLLQHFDLLEEPVAVLSGRVALDATVKSGAYAPGSWSQQSHLHIQDVAGSVSDYRFDGLALNANWSGVTHWQTLAPAEISLANLDLGFPVADVQARISLPRATPIASPLVRIEAFSAGLFGGRLFLAQPQSWDFAAASNRLTLQAQNWQLAALVALQSNTDIQAQGTLEGELPMTIAGGRVIVDNGYLRALPPGGSIRYTPSEASRSLAAGSEDLGMALDLLRDFQYQVLTSEVQLDAAGNLLLGLSLQGSNPGLYEGQPVHFNINLEQNIDPLLQSLRLSGKLVERIEGALE